MRRWGSLTVSVLLAFGAACGSPTSPSTPRLSLIIGVDLPLTGREARAAVPSLVANLVSREVPVYGAAPRPPTVEEIYFALQQQEEAVL